MTCPVLPNGAWQGDEETGFPTCRINMDELWRYDRYRPHLAFTPIKDKRDWDSS